MQSVIRRNDRHENSRTEIRTRNQWIPISTHPIVSYNLTIQSITPMINLRDCAIWVVANVSCGPGTLSESKMMIKSINAGWAVSAVCRPKGRLMSFFVAARAPKIYQRISRNDHRLQLRPNSQPASFQQRPLCSSRNVNDIRWCCEFGYSLSRILKVRWRMSTRKILESAVTHVQQWGWTTEAIALGATEQGLSPYSHGLFPRYYLHISDPALCDDVLFEAFHTPWCSRQFNLRSLISAVQLNWWSTCKTVCMMLGS